MPIDFDFLAPEVTLSANAVAAGTTVTLGTIPLASAPFPLQAGRVVRVEADFIAVDSNGNQFSAIVKHTFANNGAPNFSQSYEQQTFPATYDGGGSQVGIGSTGDIRLDGSGDLEVRWANGYSSVVTQDVAVRVRMRWVGA